MAITNLATHAAPYVTVRELADYWRISQKQIRRRVAEGRLSGLRLGPRICRISVASALAFERASEQALVQPAPIELKATRRTLVDTSRRGTH
jgi:excisionase family DNA binding protein